MDEEMARIMAAADKWGLPPYVGESHYIRSRKIFWAGDRGLLSYRTNGKAAKPTTDLESVTQRCQLFVSAEAGYGPADWTRDLLRLVSENEGRLERVEVEDMPVLASGFRSTSTQLRFPPNVHCFVYDNLNACANKAHTSYTLSLQPEAELKELFVLMGR